MIDEEKQLSKVESIIARRVRAMSKKDIADYFTRMRELHGAEKLRVLEARASFYSQERRYCGALEINFDDVQGRDMDKFRVFAYISLLEYGLE